MAYSSLAIANEFLIRAHKQGISLNQMQLQKLVYIAHGANLAINGEPLIEDGIEAWDYGTVIRRLRDALKKHGVSSIDQLIKWGDDMPIYYRSKDKK